MDNLKKPEVIISGANAVGLIVVTAYFYKNIGELNNEIVELKKHIAHNVNMTVDVQKQASMIQQIAPMLGDFKNDIETISKRQRRMMTENKNQSVNNANLAKYCESLNKKIVELGGEPINMDLEIEPVKVSNNRGRSKNNTQSRYRPSISDDDDDDYDERNDRSYNQSVGKYKRRNKRRSKISEDEDEYDDDDDDDDDIDLDSLINMVKKVKNKGNRR